MRPGRRWFFVLALVLATAVVAPPLLGEEECFECHASADEIGEARLVVDLDTWSATVHGSMELSCLDCHGDEDGDPHAGVDPEAGCANCHDAPDTLATSVHAPGGDNADRKPTCADCHGSIHRLVSRDDPDSPVSEHHLAEACGRCHADPSLARDSGIKLVQPMAAYTASVHALGIERGEHAATCASCHGSHDILPGADPSSPVHRENIPTTCAQCHAGITATYEASVHGQAAAQGIQESPVCTDCHGEHRILGPADEGSPVYATNVPKLTCGRCHGDLRITEKFGMKTDAVEAFEDSFHGLAGRAGSLTVANCASCHGVHDILPSSDPRSHVAPARLAETCGSCHPGAGSSFQIGAVHVLPQSRGSAHPAVYWVRIAYLWLIWGTIGGMLLHNLLDLYRKARHPLVRPAMSLSERRPRMPLGFRIAHAALFTSFFALVWSGFALKVPDASWAAPLLLWEESFGLRGWLHRGAAIVMLAAFAFHFVHIAIDRRARRCILGMVPTKHDLDELRAKIAWFFGRRKEMPHAPALGYAEKAEYLALLWGTLVMAVSGFVLWFENWSLANLPKWASDVATVVHFYEAILASLAILVWHFYFVIFDPLVYPMDTAWLTGREAPGRSLERTEAFRGEGDDPDAAG